MMVGMMAVPALPVLLLRAGVHAQRVDRGVTPAVPSFGLGYLIVWLAFSACATAAQWALHEGALLSPTMATSSTSVAGVILIAAGAYQLTPLKTGCLARCQSPLGFLMSNWRDGSIGVLLMGFRHGVFWTCLPWREKAMTTTDTATRLIELERQQRRGRRLAWGALCLLPVSLGAFASGGPDPVVRAEQVELVTATGTRQALLNADSTGVTLTLFTVKGRPASALRLSDSTLTLLDASGEPVATLGGPRVRHLVE